jgi:hypothetical protein
MVTAAAAAATFQIFRILLLHTAKFADPERRWQRPFSIRARRFSSGTPIDT